MTVAIWLALAACLLASVFDVRARRIPNWLTGAVVILAVIVHSFGGWRDAALAAGVMVAMTLLGTLLYSFGGIGGGDVKLAIAVSGMLSFPLCLPFLLYSALGGGLLAVAFVLMRGNVRQSLARAAVMASAGPQSVAGAKAPTLPYALAFAFGAVLIALAQSVAPFLRILS